MIKVLAIDDEPLALLQLKKMISQIPYFQLVAACSDALDAMRVMEENDVDAIFTDINMPDMSGLDFVRTLSSAPIIVFTTAYSQYAVEGYKVNAVDYLLKPFGLVDFQQTAAKVKQRYDLLQRSNAESRMEGDVLFVKVDYRIVRILVSEIRYIESQSEYLRLYMKNGESHMVLMSIKRIVELLPSEFFIRIHRSYVVNMAAVVEIAKLRIKMDASTYLPIGDLYKDEVLKYINDRLIGK